MAVMFPDEVSDFATPGEGTVYRFLEHAARPDREFTAWYSPHVEDLEPDFILFGPEIGLLVIEVKDWRVGQILQANPESFELRIGRKRQLRKNPLRQAEGYSRAVRKRLEAEPLLCHRQGRHRGKPAIPVSEAVAFPNIGEEDFARAGLAGVLGREKTLLAEDLDEQGLAADPSGARFRQELARRIPPRFPFTTGQAERDALRQALFPQIRIEHPLRERGEAYQDRRSRLSVLDRMQEQTARQLGKGHRVFTGPSGSGKTLVLVHRAELLSKYEPSVRRILFVCFNATLTGYLRELLSLNRVRMGEDAVEVLPFFEVCERVIGEKVAHEGEESAYYDLIIEETLSRIERGEAPTWDAILVDEGQDFSTPMLRVVRGLLAPSSDNLLIAVDEGQDIYRRSRVWKEAGIQATGRVRHLRHVYRSSQRLVGFSRRLVQGLGRAAQLREAPETLPLPLPAISLDDGPSPELVELGDLDGVVREAAGWLRGQTDGVRPLSECAVLYARTNPADGAQPSYPERIQRELSRAGLDSQWASENYAVRRGFRISTNAVTVSTIHSAKGLDWECVAVLGLDELGGDELTRHQRLLAYVAVCRARRRLLIPYVRRTPLIELLIESARSAG